VADLITIQRDSYHDSVLLMRLTLDLEQHEGVEDAIVAMATEHNRSLLADGGYSHPELAAAGPNDLVIAVRGDTLDLDEAGLNALVDELLASAAPDQSDSEEAPTTLDAALARQPETQLVLISLPGEHTAREARRALQRDRHVMIFSDNVSVEDERALKAMAKERGLLVMGPDCGTAILGGKPLAFANVVRRGNIGVVGASGTGIQEVTSCIDRLGGGVSQAIGTGGRDLSEAIGGATFLAGLEALRDDDETSVLVAISKPPSPVVAEKVLEALAQSGLPAVVHFVGDQPGREAAGNIIIADSLAACAEHAVELAGVEAEPAPQNDPELAARLAAELPTEATLCGLFCGGTTGYEALLLLERAGVAPRSNLTKDADRKADGTEAVAGHVLYDLGDDVFTRGRPHPMIEPALRTERLLEELEAQPDRALLLFDCVLGYGSHTDPAGLLAESIEQARERFAERPLVALASVTGTSSDPQGYERSRERLAAAGIHVLPDNRRAAELCAAVLAARSAS
jgi:FdrA protein